MHFCKKCGHRLDNSTTYPKNEELSDNKSMNDEEATIYIPVDESQGYSYKVNPDDAASKAYENNTGMNYNHTYTTEEELPEKFKPIGVWAYFGWTLLFLCVPFGWIVAIVFAVGSTENVNLKNFSKAICLFLLVTVAIIFLFFIFTSCTAGMLML